MIFETVYSCPVAKKINLPLFMAFKRKMVQMVTMQAMKINEFLHLFIVLKDEGVKTYVVKGIICSDMV